MTPAEELRAAATRLREAAARATPGPWEDFSTGDDGAWPRLVTGEGEGADVITVHEEIADFGVVTREDVAWIALANPALAEPIAAWLEDTAGAAAGFTQTHGAEIAERVVWHALAVARQINGGAQ